MSRLGKLKRQLIEEANKKLLGESYSGIIKKGDDSCEIRCKRKLAKNGSNGDVVKYIQHLLAANGFNPKYKGGGMGLECSDSYEGCDGKYREHTKDAVIEFQRKYKSSVDGVVGYNTLMKMCEVFKPLSGTQIETVKSYGLLCKDCFCNKQDQPIGGEDRDEKDIPSPTDDSIVDELEIIDCEDLKYCVGKHLYQTSPDILAFYRCVSEKVGLTDEPPKDQRQGCTDSAGNNLCKMIPEPIPQGRMTTAVMGYYYDPSKGKCVSVSGGPAPFRQMDKCTECCQRKK